MVTGFDMSKAKQSKREMSKGFNSPFSSQLSPPIAQQQDDALKNTPLNNVQLVPAASSSSLAGPSTWQPPSHWNLDQPLSAYSTRKIAKLKLKSAEEQEIITQTAARFASCLVSDHANVLHPDVDSPFSDYSDVLNRLLPYHVFQQPCEDLLGISRSNKGKEKATDLKAEVEETKFALECYKRKDDLRRRLRKITMQSAKRSAPNDQAYVLEQAVLEADRLEMTWLSSELRTARSELDKLEKDKRAVVNANRAATVPNPYMHAQYYRSYPYSYAQPYGAPTQIPPGSISTFSVAPPVSGMISSTATSQQASAAIPVQLPVASLPALHALGIMPVPASSLPPEGQVQPPAILRGSTANGTMLSLEINVSLLQSAQMSGLAMVLNSLMSRSTNGVNSSYTVASTSQAPVPSGTSGTNAGSAG